jgi:hypothetical protein
LVTGQENIRQVVNSGAFNGRFHSTVEGFVHYPSLHHHATCIVD